MIERIEITQRFTFKKSQKHYECFIIDLINKNAYFNISEMIYPNQFFENSYSADDLSEAILNDLKSRISSEIYRLDDDSINSFVDEFNKLNLFENFESENFTFFEKIENIYSCNINFYFTDKYEEFSFKNNFPDKWVDFNCLLIKLFNFDVLNIAYLEKIVTNLFYDVCRECVCDKLGNKLELTFIEFGHYESDNHPYPSVSVDFKNNAIEGYFEKENVDLKILFGLLEKYGVYLWIFDSYQNKSKKHDLHIIDDYDWYLELIFNDSVIWNISGHNEYPDTYVCLAREVRKLTGYDLLEISSIPDGEIDAFNYYGKMKLSKK